jgi:hypothetical protein
MSSIQVEKEVLLVAIIKYRQNVMDKYNEQARAHNKWYEESLDKYNKSNWLLKIITGKPSPYDYSNNFCSAEYVYDSRLRNIESIESLVRASTGLVTVSHEHAFLLNWK